MTCSYKVGKWGFTLVLMLCFTVGEVGRYLVGTLSKPMAQDLEFGNQRCMPINVKNETFPSLCFNTNKTMCNKVTHGNESVCYFDYDGSGVEYQILAGPAFIAMFSVGGIIMGVLGDIHNRVKLLTFSVFLSSILTFLTGFSTQYWHLIIFRMLFAFGESGCTPLSASLIADRFSHRSRAFAMSLYTWGIYVGYGLAFLIGIYITELNVLNQGWKFSYFITGLPGILLAFVLILFLKEPERKTIEQKSSTNVTEQINHTDNNNNSNQWFAKVLVSLKAMVTKPSVMLLVLSACVRHSASYCWAYNAKLYFDEYFPGSNLPLWMSLGSILGGSMGIISGGLVSDFIARHHGVQTRLWVLVVSQGIATPLAALVVTVKPPYCFIALFVAYFFAEMWYGVMIASLVEMVPHECRSTCLAITTFVTANVAGNLPVLVAILEKWLKGGLRMSLIVMYPGLYGLSSLMFLVTQIVLTQEVKIARKKDKNITLVTDAQQEVLIKNEDKSLNY